MSERMAQTGGEQDKTNGGSWECVDERPFECPNGHGLLEVESATSVWCPECDYTRTVIDYVDD